MSGYDGPSIFKKNNSKNTSVGQQKENKETTLFENQHAGSLPKTVQTRADLQKEAQNYMKTSPAQSYQAGAQSAARFRNKYIPPSMQKKDEHVDKIKQKNEWLHTELTKRLIKEVDTYLFFEEEGRELDSNFPSSEQAKPKTEKNKKRNAQNLQNSKDKFQKIKTIKKNMDAQQKKSTTGLQRSLENILEEEQEILRNHEQHLDSLFSEKKRN